MIMLKTLYSTVIKNQPVTTSHRHNLSAPASSLLHHPLCFVFLAWSALCIVSGTYNECIHPLLNALVATWMIIFIHSLLTAYPSYEHLQKSLIGMFVMGRKRGTKHTKLLASTGKTNGRKMMICSITTHGGRCNIILSKGAKSDNYRMVSTILLDDG